MFHLHHQLPLTPLSTNPPPWQVDLGSRQALGSIEVWGRTDCCPQITGNFYVLVSDQQFAYNDLATARAQSGVSSYYVAGYSALPEQSM